MSVRRQFGGDYAGIIDSEKLTAEDIATLLPDHWTFTYVDIKSALNYYYPKATIR